MHQAMKATNSSLHWLVHHYNVGVKCKGVGKSCNSDQFLAVARKRLKIDGYMLRCV